MPLPPSIGFAYFCPQFNPTPIPSPKWEGGLISCFFYVFVFGINEQYEDKPPSHLGEGMGVGLNRGQKYAKPIRGGIGILRRYKLRLCMGSLN